MQSGTNILTASHLNQIQEHLSEKSESGCLHCYCQEFTSLNETINQTVTVATSNHQPPYLNLNPEPG